MTSPKSSLRSPVAKRGFSLVLSLVVMAMLLLLCISAAALLAIELRVSRVTVSYSKARLNALAGARIALGTLQGLAGTDRAVSANAAILATDSGKSSQVRRPRLPGVWRSAVVSSDYDNAHTAAFKGWLMSGNDAAGLPLAVRSPANARSGLDWMLAGAADKADDEWLLLDGGRTPYAGEAKLREDFDDSPGGREPLRLYARPEYISGSAASGGAFAWVAMDENQKARVDLREFTSSDASQGGFSESDRAVFSASAAARFHPGNPSDGAQLRDWSSGSVVRDGRLTGGWGSLPLDPNGNPPSETTAPGWFPLESGKSVPARALRHDFTLESGSLLTDTINGGLKRDLNTLALMNDGEFDTEAAHFGDAPGYVGPDNDRQSWYGSGATGAAAGVFAFTGNDNKIWPLWSDVREWAKLATSGGVVTVSGGAPTVETISKAHMADLLKAGSLPDRKYHAAWRQPVISRIRFEEAVFAMDDPATTAQVRIAYKLNSVVQLWNPYNVKLKMPGGAYWLGMRGVPLAVRWYGGGTGGNGQVPGTFYMGVPLDGTDMEPGECRTFSLPTGISRLTTGVMMNPGYLASGGWTSDVTVAVAPTSVLTYSVGRLGDPNITGASALSSSNPIRDGCVDLYRTSTFSPPAATDLVTRIGDTGNNWIQMPAGYPVMNKPLPPISQLFLDHNYTVAVFEYRLKQEKLPAIPGRFTPPALLHQSGWSTSFPPTTVSNNPPPGTIPDWNASPMELVGWDPKTTNDPEKFGDLSVLPAAAGVTKGFFHTGNTPATGVLNAVYYHAPLSPPVGLGDLRNARLGGGLRALPSGTQDAYANGYATFAPFGNSLASPFVSLDKVLENRGKLAGAGTGGLADFNGPDRGVRPVDHSWVMNTALADTWFASSLGNWNQGATATLFSVKKDYQKQFSDFFTGGLPLPNRRFSPIAVTDAETKWVSGTNATKDAYRQIAQGMLVEGGFNINSTSKRAWRAFLASSRDSKTVKQLAGAFTATGLANTGSALPASISNEDPVATGGASNAANNAKRVNGGRYLSDTELDDLAVELVKQVKLRGPFLSLGEFLNRRVESGPLGYKGAVQAAIDTAKLNAHLAATGVAPAPATTALGNPEVDKVYDYSGVGQPGWLSQADLVAPLLPSMTPRGDTFTIRVAGESDDGARAYCEITVRRTYAFVDGRDSPDAEFNPATGAAQHIASKAFGRRFAIVSQRWMTREEI